MKTKTKNGKRNTGALYWRLSQLPGYEPDYREVIKEGAVNDLYERIYGVGHRRSLSVSAMTDHDFSLLLQDLDKRITENRSVAFYHKDAERRAFISKIFKRFERMGVTTGNKYAAINDHVQRIPMAKGRIIPEISTEELPELFKAVCSYVAYYEKKQREEREASFKN